MILSLLRSGVRAHGLLATGDRALAAVSGGGDSVAMLRLLVLLSREIPFEIVVGHVNHRLRGAASDEDQRFVEELAARLGLACRVMAPGPDEAWRMARGTEEAMRSVRHALLARAAREEGCSRIALAHTMEDQAETFIMRLVRGAGRRGLSAMAPSGPGPLIRPMLGITRSQARAFLARLGQEFREDATNDSPRFLRNRVRSRLLPVMRELNPAIVRRLAGTARLLAEEDRYLDSLGAGWLDRAGRPAPGAGLALPARGVDSLGSLPITLARRVVRLAIARAGGDPRGAGQAAVAAVLRLARKEAGGGPLLLSGGMRVVREGHDLVIAAEPAPSGPPEAAAREETRLHLELPIPGRAAAPLLAGELRASVIPRSEAGDPAGREQRVCLDAGLMGPVATVRTRVPGDTFHPLGAPGGRKLSDFLIDRKVPRNKRDSIPLVVGPVGIAWVVGQRIGHPYRITASTRSVAVLEFHPRVDQG